MLDTLGKKQQRRSGYLKLICQSIAFIGLIAVFVLQAAYEDNYVIQLRYLEEECEATNKLDEKWMVVLYIFGVLYMFLALAIVCDEFFVPALEEMSSSRRLNLSLDVAGATLMAAGGSAPELFSSLFGTFQESEIGFGTIIGSAVFNVLFVIAMCSVFAKETLELTWWPLFRDSFCYAIGLGVLSIFVGVTSPEEIEIWEAAVLFVMYLCYTLIMWKNGAIYFKLTGKELEYAEEDDEDGDDENDDKSRPGNEEEAPNGNTKSKSSASIGSSGSGRSSSLIGALTLDTLQNSILNGTRVDFRWQGTFRAGILKLLRNPNSWAETGGVGIVAKMDGDADQVFKEIDVNGNGLLDREELLQLFDKLGYRVSDREVDEVFTALDIDKNGSISEEEFHRWYTSSAELIKSQVRNVFDELDVNNSGTIDSFELKQLLIQLDPNVSDEDVEKAIDDMYQSGSREEITFQEFSEWYEKSMIFEQQMQRVEEDKQGAWESLKPPNGEGCISWAQYIIVLPLVFVMVITVPDVRIPGKGKWCYVAFLLSIAWIGAFSYLMVDWAELIGNTIGIPSVVMGLTILAAGTSVPDLLSSVIVARRGSGDMAVSSSIGSNIFDILVGLPVPWMIYTAFPSKPNSVSICSDNIFVSLLILLAMLIFVIFAVHCQGWRLTKTLGFMMILFYLAFLAASIAMELPFETCKVC